MLNNLVFVSLFIFTYSFFIKNYNSKYRTLEFYYDKNFNSKIKRCNNLNAIRIIDHNITNKTVYEKFEYYSIIGNYEKQEECLKEILLLSNQSKN